MAAAAKPKGPANALHLKHLSPTTRDCNNRALDCSKIGKSFVVLIMKEGGVDHVASRASCSYQRDLPTVKINAEI